MKLRDPFVLAVALLASVHCDVTPPASTPAPAVQLPPRPKGWRWDNEEHWLVSEIAGSVAALATLARHPQVIAPEDLAVRVVSLNQKPGSNASLQPLEARLRIGREATEHSLVAKDYLFSPSAWAPVAAAVIPAAAGASDLAGPLLPDERFLETLLDLRATVLQKENRRLSAALERDGRDPAANEQAALLVGAFALREAAGGLTDERPALTRMTAHLAVARAARPGEPGLAGRYAEIVLLSLVQRQRDAMERIERLEGASPTPVEAAWLRALRLRNTGDWRRRSAARDASLLERLEGFRAVRQRLSVDAANEQLREAAREPVADWARITLSRPGNVEACGVFGSRIVDQNLREALDILEPGERAAPETTAALIKSLTETTLQGGLDMTNGRVSFAVLDKGLWGRFLERHVVHALFQEYACLSWIYGMNEEAVAYAGRGREAFAALPSLRLVGWAFIYGANDANRGLREAIGVLEREPERAPAAIWTDLRKERNYPSLLSSMPDESLWFSTGFPRGTAYDTESRLHRIKTVRTLNLDDKVAFRRMAPYDLPAIWSDFRGMGGKPTLATVEQGAAEMMKYDSRLLESLLLTWPTDLALYKPVGRQLCELDSRYWGTYGLQLADLGDEAGALDAFRQMLAKTRDEVSISNTVHWLVDYEFEHGRPDEAMKLARRAAATGSAAGYWLLGRQLELRGDLQGAFGAMQTIQERYEEREDMVTMYLRHEDAFRGTPVEARVKPVVAEIFPLGLEPVALSALAGAPRDGVRLLGPDPAVSDRMTPLGLKRDAVVVGLNGFRVHTREQYHCLRWARTDPALDLLVWQDGRYVAVRAALPNRTLRTDLAEYAGS